MAPSTDWKEIVAPDEDARFERYGAQLAELQTRNAKGGPKRRALHAKGHGGFVARLEVLPDLPEPARHGLFALPATYEALVRFSNGAGAIQRDRQGDVRGIAVKVLGVDGEKVLGDARTQDFLAILSSATPFRTADEFVALVWATRSPALALPRLIGAFGLRAFGLLRKLLAGINAPVASLAQRRFYSALPIQCGPYAARFALTPVVEGPAATLGAGVDYLADDLATRLRDAALTYELSLQFFVDEQRTPIEDGSVDWPETIAPYVPVARLVIPAQDATGEQGRRTTALVESLSFDPWHARVEHRPLGGMMRARKHAYFASTKGRGAAAEPERLEVVAP
jgi:hypothetical protein